MSQRLARFHFRHNFIDEVEEAVTGDAGVDLPPFGFEFIWLVFDDSFLWMIQAVSWLVQLQKLISANTFHSVVNFEKIIDARFQISQHANSAASSCEEIIADQLEVHFIAYIF